MKIHLGPDTWPHPQEEEKEPDFSALSPEDRVEFKQALVEALQDRSKALRAAAERQRARKKA